jgi:Icc-related predicted phosphoesterase
MKNVIITCISDSHMQHDQLDLDAGGELLIHAGDWGSWGTMPELFEFNQWLGTLGFAKIINIAGNHDEVCQSLGYEKTKQLFTNSTYLQDNMVEWNGLKIYGTPYSNQFGHWSFMKKDEDLAKIWAKIPTGIDILVVHGPAYGILDKAPNWGGPGFVHTGSMSLHEQIFDRIKPKLVVHGHIHCDSGYQEVDGIKFVNAAVLDDNYTVQNKPFTITLTL